MGCYVRYESYLQLTKCVASNWESVTTDLQSIVSCLGAKDTTQSLWKVLVGLLKKHCCHKKYCQDAWDVLQCSKA